MYKYDYLEEMKKDIIRWINATINVKDYSDKDELYDYLNDALWAEDEITGNGIFGKYFENKEDARIAVMDNFELCNEALTDFCCPKLEVIGEKFLDADWNYFDCAIRCYLLGQAIEAVVDQIYEEDKNNG